MKPGFKLIDFVQIAPDKELCSLSKRDKVKFIDSIYSSEETERKRGLSISWYLSHSGRRINNRIYTVKGQQDGISTILTPYPKPILQHHDSHNDPLGRFTGGQWESLSAEAMLFFSNVNDYMEVQDAFEKDDPKKIYAALKKFDLLVNKAWPGLGRMSVSARITDQNAIEKFLDGRYITFSAGSTTDRHVCSICYSDWADGDICEHRHGKIYDGDVCVFITGKFEVLEGSVVNMPADDLSQVQSMEILDKVISRKFDDLQLNAIVDPTTIYITDSIYNKMENDMAEETVQVSEKPVEETPVEVEAQDEEVIASDNQENASEDVVEIPSVALTGDFDADVTLASEDADTDAPADIDDKLINSLIQKLQERGMLNVPAASEEVQPAQDSGSLCDTQEEEKEEVCEASDGASEEGIHQEEVLGEDPNTDDVDWYLLSAALDHELGDAKLSTEQRKKLAAGTFCGPERSFPVPDCAHVTAARRLVGRAKLSASQEERVLACVNRKAKSMSCDEEDGQLAELKKDYTEALKRIQMLEGRLEKAINAIAEYRKDSVSTEKDENKLEILWTYFDSIDTTQAVESKSVVIVEDPSVSSSDESSKTNPNRKRLGNFEQNIINTYTKLLDDDGIDAAEYYLRSKKQYLPRGFHPSKL